MPATNAAATAQSFAFDGTTYEIRQTSLNHGIEGFEVRVTEGELSLALYTVDGADLSTNAATTLASLVAKPAAWTASRIAYVFALAARKVWPLAAELARA